MTEPDSLTKARQGGFFTKLSIYGRLSGPAWIQAAVTLGGGSLVGALYLGVIGGYEFLWLQPLAMLCGIVMLGAISYVTLSCEERPFRLMQDKVSPTLAWGWLLATVVANVVFCAAQFGLGRGAIESNLGGEGLSPFLITGVLFLLSLGLVALSQRPGPASQVIDHVLKGLVGVIVVAFVGVVGVLIGKGAVPVGELLSGLVPDFGALFRPTSEMETAIEATQGLSTFWSEYVIAEQRNRIITAFGTAVAVNMTFLLPYTLRRRGWGKAHRELARFDLALGLFLPFVLGVSALVIASAASFHAESADVLDEEGSPLPGMEAIFYEVVDKRLAFEHQAFGALPEEEVMELREALPLEEKRLAAMLANRKVDNLARALEPFLGGSSQIIFGVGVLAMAISTMLVHMMMNGYAISEACNRVGQAKIFLLGASMPALTGLFSPWLWSGASKAAMAVPASVTATTLLPIAYLAFFLLMNSRAALGSELPRRRAGLNGLLLGTTGVATLASVWALSGKGSVGILGMGALILLAAIGVLGFLKRNRPQPN
ncbi:MAG: divalent metal cation transporter [Verrucomicrobiota bacterium]